MPTIGLGVSGEAGTRVPTTDYRPPTTYFRHGKKTLDFNWALAELGIGAGVVMCTEVRASWAIVGTRRIAQSGNRKVYFLRGIALSCAITGLQK